MKTIKKKYIFQLFNKSSSIKNKAGTLLNVVNCSYLISVEKGGILRWLNLN